MSLLSKVLVVTAFVALALGQPSGSGMGGSGMGGSGMGGSGMGGSGMSGSTPPATSGGMSGSGMTGSTPPATSGMSGSNAPSGSGTNGTGSPSSTTTTTNGSSTTAAPLNNVTSNHYVGLFSGAIYFPYATAFCQPLNLFGTAYGKYTCLDTNTMKYETFSDSSCNTRTANVNITKNSSIPAGAYNYFQCSGSNGYYAKVGLAAETTNTSSAKTDGCTTSNQVTVAAALRACAPTSDPRLSFSVYCDSSHAELQYFGGCAVRLGFAFSVKAYTTCDYLFVNNGTGTTVYVYGQLNTCELSGTTTTTTSTTTTSSGSTTTSTTTTSSAPFHFTILSLILSIIAYIFA